MILGFCIKVAVVVAAVSYSRRVGVWGTAPESEVVYESVEKEMRPIVERVEKCLPFHVPPTPPTGEWSFLGQHYYNRGVEFIFGLFAALPTFTASLIDKAVLSFKQYKKRPPRAEPMPYIAPSPQTPPSSVIPPCSPDEDDIKLFKKDDGCGCPSALPPPQQNNEKGCVEYEPKRRKSFC